MYEGVFSERETFLCLLNTFNPIHVRTLAMNSFLNARAKVEMGPKRMGQNEAETYLGTIGVPMALHKPMPNKPRNKGHWRNEPVIIPCSVKTNASTRS